MIGRGSSDFLKMVGVCCQSVGFSDRNNTSRLDSSVLEVASACWSCMNGEWRSHINVAKMRMEMNVRVRVIAKMISLRVTVFVDNNK